jgi:hypothetical protein
MLTNSEPQPTTVPETAVTLDLSFLQEDQVKKQLWAEHNAAWRAFFPKEVPAGWTIHQADLRWDVYPRSAEDDRAATSLASFITKWQ